jgi:succinoglycan biosynthesis transport protein ExoP
MPFRPVNPETEVYYPESRPGRPPNYLDDDDGGLLEYWRILKRRKGTILLAALAGVVLSILIGLPQTPEYRAEGTLEIQDVNSDFMHQKQITPIDGGDDSDVQTQVLIIESASLFDRVAEKLNVSYKNVDLPWRSQGARAVVSKLLHQPPPEPTPLVNPNNLRVRPSGPTRIVDITYDSPDARLAADVVNTLSSEYIESNIEARWKMSEHTGEWLTRQLREMRGELEHSEAALQQYAVGAGLVFTSGDDDTGKTNVADQKLIQLQDELSKAQADRVSAQSRYEMTKAVPADTLPDVLNDSSLRGLQDKLTDLRRQQADLIVVYTANDDKLKRINAQIVPLQAALERVRTDILGRINNEYETAVRRETLLRTDYAAQSRIVADQAEKSIHYNLLKREVDSNRQLYEAMLQQVKQSTVASALQASNIRVLDKATVPFFPYSPNYGLNSIIGLLTGILAGVTLVIVRARSNGTVQQPGEAQFWLNVPELGVIRTVTKNPYLVLVRITPNSVHSRRKILTDQLAGGGDTFVPTKPAKRKLRQRLEFITWDRKPSPASESFRAVRASLLLSGQTERPPKVLVLASANPSEGKTVVACNLAIALSEINHKVLLIDADLRKPRIHSLFEVPHERGLSTYLREPTVSPESPALDGLIQATFIPNLFMLPSGAIPASPASLFHSPSLLELLSYCRNEFDTIIIDTPAVQEMSDARVLGGLSDGVILIIRAGHTTRAAAAAAVQRFAEDGTRILGVILNDWDPKSSPRGY